VLGKDAASDLERAAARFQEKPTWGHARPEVVRAHPALAANGLGPAAAGLGLRVVADRRIQPGLVYLGVGENETL
jgi:hypothetical protein